MLKARILTVLVLLPLLLAALFFLPNVYWAVLMLFVLLIGASEWARMASYSVVSSSIFLFLTGVFGLALLFIFKIDTATGTWLNLSLYGLSLFFWTLVAPVWLSKGLKISNGFVLGLVGWIILIPTWLALVQLKSISPVLLLALMAVIWAADTAAYFAGKRFGNNKLAPTISPGKTWEGVIGALVGVSIYALIWLNSSNTLHEATARVGGIPVITVIIAVWLMTYFSVLGDLFESWMKRQAGLKDSGNILPGHGGILDRIDALTSTLPLAALVVFYLNSTLSIQ
ncbi:phosphatidate cytidylyltransferase [Sulfurirhabdus autotrophica]|uniref:Phosphatidate cytidylyltransferase n=1 Tax=Sulfurirhabdus autotrophica TaxID=1706046 RepID=A0A4R3YE45_9PROT|nr:phosphatidate cytidylyltransferase [Sulfurirhabdus autotrophica]TCV90181.1 phosphatidate cytidylyltransferase [Sulfurirhabdus autotrophica]